MVKKKIYCADDKILPEGYTEHGSRYQCLRKGFFIGTMLEKEARSKGKTKFVKRTPNKKPKIFCGNRTLPNGYTRYGTRFECLRKGIGGAISVESKKYNKNGEKEYKEEKEGKSDDHKRFGNKKKKSSVKKSSSKEKRSSKKKKSKSKKKSQKRKSSSKKKSKKKRSSKRKKSTKKSNKKRISSYNKFVQENYNKVKKKYKLSRSEDVFLKIAKLWSKHK